MLMRTLGMISLLIGCNSAYRNRLSDSELEFSANFQRLVHESFHKTVLNNLPESLRSLDQPEMIALPDISKGVIFRVLDDVGPYRLENGYEKLIFIVIQK